MSRDLSFWKIKKVPSITDESIYKALSEGKSLPFVEEIPVDKVLADFQCSFKEWKIDDRFYEKENEAFELMYTNQFVRVDCYGLSEHHMNKIIDIMDKFECPLYDSVINIRFG